MKLLPINNFLTIGQGQIPSGFRGAAIHPSSEVDLVDIGSARLGVGGVVPLTGGSTVKAVRALASNPSTVGESLVLALFESCDVMVPQGPRVPVSKSVVLDAQTMGAIGANATFALRLPFQGRQQAAISFRRSDATKDLSLFVLGARAGFRGQAGPVLTSASDTETWWDGVAAPTSPQGFAVARTIYVGGQGDNVEAFDELIVYVFGPAAAGAETVTVVAEAWGERCK